MHKNLPNFQHTFYIDVVGDQTKEKFSGEFTYNRPNLRTISEISKFKARLDGGLSNIEKETGFIHNMISQLRFTISAFPKWWEGSDFGLDLYDLNVVVEVYNNVMDFETKFFNDIAEEVKKEKQDDKKTETTEK